MSHVSPEKALETPLTWKLRAAAVQNHLPKMQKLQTQS